MSAAARLGAYASLLAAVFVIAFFGARVVVPDSVVEDWSARADQQHHTPTTSPTSDPDGAHDGAHDGDGD